VVADCDDAQVSSLAPCALDLAGLVPTSGEGCLAVTHVETVREALAAVVPR